MPSVMNVAMPEAMIESIENLAKVKNCSSNTVIKLAVAKFLFDQDLSTPETHNDETKINRTAPEDVLREIPMEKIVAVHYTLDDGRVIHILRERKLH